MNWVGGSRSRLMMKDDIRKQRDFFEKRRMQRKLKSLGLSLPSSAGGSSPGSGSMDLVTLFIVNQIATKKESNDNPKVPVFGGSSRKGSSDQNKPLVLPMSPCSPSRLSLVDSPYSSQGMSKDRNIIPPGFKCHQLSPVMESGFSDNSASDYVQPKADTLSPFSSTSLSPSSLGGVFSLQVNHQQTQQLPPPPPPPPPPPFWDTPALERTDVHPCSQSTGTAENMPWLFGSDPPPFQLETPTAAQVLFGSPHGLMNDVGDHPRSQTSFSLNQLEETDFTLEQSESEQQFEDNDVFSGFSNDFGEKDAFHYDGVKSKIFLKDETPAQSSASHCVSESQRMDVKLCDSRGNDLSCPGNMTNLQNSCESSPKSCCRRGREDSSDLNDVDLSYAEQACCADARSQVSPPTERDMPSTAETGRGIGDGATEETVRSTSPPTAVHNLNTEICRCKSQVKTHDAETQTVGVLAAERRDVSTQCSDSEDCTPAVPRVNLPPVARPLSVIQSPTRGQTLTVAHPNMHVASSASRGQRTPSSDPAAVPLQVNSPLSSNRRDGNMFLQTVLQHVPGALSETDGRVKSD